MFFALSGHLLTDRALKGSLPDFVIARILRIFPLLIMVNALIGGVFFLFSTVPASSYWPEAIGLVYHDLFSYGQWTLPVSFHNIPEPVSNVVNTAEWSIFFELRCYALLVVLAFIGVLRNQPLLNAFVLIIALLRPDATCINWEDARAFQVALAFLSGCFLCANKIRLDFRHFVAAAVLLIGLFHYNSPSHYGQNFSDIIETLCVVVITVSFAFGNVPYIRAADRMPDLTYDIFLLHWPIQRRHRRPKSGYRHAHENPHESLVALGQKL
jgi:peptidoglycan/LPS O-acetylase OafA/YrhL